MPVSPSVRARRPVGLVVVAVIALVIVSLLKRPFVRGLVIGAIILGIIALVWL